MCSSDLCLQGYASRSRFDYLIKENEGQYRGADISWNYWGTTNASQIVNRVYGYYDDFGRVRVSMLSPILAGSRPPEPTGPANPIVSITGYSGTTANPVVNLALAATSATQMLVSDDHTFPPQFQWEPFAATKEFHSDGTKYIYAKFKDAAGNESAIAFAQPRRLMYITKSATLASRPVLLQVKVPAGYGISQVRAFYRPIGGSSYTGGLMALQGEVYSLWAPASQTANGIEYYFQAENASGGVLATLPESNPAGQPYVLPATSVLAQSVQAGSNAAFELAVGVTVEIPAGALAQDTELQVTALTAAPAPPEGITATGVGYAFSFADGTTTFGQPVALTFNYADSDVAGLDPADLRV